MANESSSVEYWKSVPKVELHRHLEGSLRLSTIKELAAASTNTFNPPLAKPVTDEAIISCFCVTTPVPDLKVCLDRFWNVQSLLDSEQVVERVAFEACEDARADGVRLLELRYSPGFICLNHPNLTHESVHAAVIRGIDRARSKFTDMAVGLIGIIDRNTPIPDAERAMQFIIDHRADFVGVDLANDEEGFDCRGFAPCFERARAAGLHVTCHSGEVDTPESPGYVRDAITHLGAQRIGHGLMVSRSDEVMAFVKERGVLLEVSVTSNYLTNVIPALDKHPFPTIEDAGIPVSINSDDPGLFNITLSSEYAMVAESYGWTEAHFKDMNDRAALASFIPGDVKSRVWPVKMPRSKDR